MKRLTLQRLLSSLAVITTFVAGICVLSLAVGPSELGLGDVARVLTGRGGDAAARDIVLGVRLPRLLLSMLVGASLSTGGVVYQALLRNPLADPFVLGVSGGAALGGISVLALGAGIGLGSAAVPPAAFVGSLATLVLLHFAAGGAGRASGTSLLLTGVVFNAFASAAIVFLASLAGFVEGSRIFFWLIGSLASARYELIVPVALLFVPGVLVVLGFARVLNLMALGDEPATQLGVDVTRARAVLLVATSLLVGAAVSVSGLIGFVGLIVPHALRLVLGPDHRLLVPAAALGGAGFLALCDTLARAMLGGRELPVGAITALIGGPLFVLLLRRSQQPVFVR